MAKSNELIKLQESLIKESRSIDIGNYLEENLPNIRKSVTDPRSPAYPGYNRVLEVLKGEWESGYFDERVVGAIKAIRDFTLAEYEYIKKNAKDKYDIEYANSCKTLADGLDKALNSIR